MKPLTVDESVEFWLFAAMRDPDDAAFQFRTLYGTMGMDHLREELQAGLEPADAIRSTLEWYAAQSKASVFDESIRSIFLRSIGVRS